MSKPFVAGQTAYRCKITPTGRATQTEGMVHKDPWAPPVSFGEHKQWMPPTSGYFDGQGYGHTPEEARGFALQGLRDREAKLVKDLAKVREMLSRVAKEVQGE